MKKIIALTVSLSIALSGISLAGQDRTTDRNDRHTTDQSGSSDRDSDRGNPYPRTNADRAEAHRESGKPFVGWHERPSRGTGSGLWHCGAIPTPGCR